MPDSLRSDGSRRLRVVITGTAGSIGTAISDPLSKRWDVVPVDVVALRLGYFRRDAPSADDSTDSDRAAWLSPGDCAELVRAAVEGPVQGFSIINGVSANRYRKAEYGAAEIRLGYRPTDDAWAGG